MRKIVDANAIAVSIRKIKGSELYFLSKDLPIKDARIIGIAIYPETLAKIMSPSLHHGFSILSLVSIKVKGLYRPVRVVRIELTASVLSGQRSTTELHTQSNVISLNFIACIGFEHSNQQLHTQSNVISLNFIACIGFEHSNQQLHTHNNKKTIFFKITFK